MMTDVARKQKFAIFGMAAGLRIDSNVQLNAEQKRAARMTSKVARLLDLAQSMTGPGFPLDRKLREFVREFNNRVFMAKGDEQPQSFNVLQAFVEPHEKAFLLKILPEIFHSLDLNFVLDKLTDPNRRIGTKELMSLREGIIYHVNIPGSYQNLQFLGNDGLAFYGAAFVRHGEELSIIGIAAKGGRQTTLPAFAFNEGDLEPDRQFLRLGRENIDVNHAEFYEDDSLYPVVILTRTDLFRKTTMIQFVLEELKDIFNIYSDSRELYTYLSKERGMKINEVSEIFDKSFDKIQEYSDVFAFIREIPLSVINLDNEDELAIRRYPTELKLSENNTKTKKIKKTFSQKEVPSYVEVKSIIGIASDTKIYDWQTETFKTEQSGYWKTIGPGKSGVGKNGDRVYGRTWVTVNESWTESLGFQPTEHSGSLRVKVNTDSNDVGFIYVMRSANHPKDQYKIGFTNKDVYGRADQLYATSGQPDRFNVGAVACKLSSPR